MAETAAPVYVRAVPDGRSYCAIHGEQPGLNCPKCDEKDPAAVKAREIPGTVPATGTADFDQAVEAAVKKALAAQQNPPPAAPVNPTPAAPVA